MITEKNASTVNGPFKVLRGLSTDSKPTDVANGTEFVEINTGKKFLFNEAAGAWVEQPAGGGGTSDYADLDNKPSINGVTLTGDKTSEDLLILPTPYRVGSVLTVVEEGNYTAWMQMVPINIIDTAEDRYDPFNSNLTTIFTNVLASALQSPNTFVSNTKVMDSSALHKGIVDSMSKYRRVGLVLTVGTNSMLAFVTGTTLGSGETVPHAIASTCFPYAVGANVFIVSGYIVVAADSFSLALCAIQSTIVS